MPLPAGRRARVQTGCCVWRRRACRHDDAGLVFDFLRLVDRLCRRWLLPRRDGIQLWAERRRGNRRERRLTAPATERHQPILGRDDIAGPQGGIGLHIKRGQPERILAIAAAIGDQVLAIEERRVEIGVARAVAGHRTLDLGAEIDLGGTRRADRLAGLARRRIGHPLQGKVLAVAQPHAERDAVPGGAGVLVDAFLSERRRRDAPDLRRRRRIAGRRWRSPLRPAEQEIKKALRPRRARRRYDYSGTKRAGENSRAPVQPFAATPKYHGTT